MSEGLILLAFRVGNAPERDPSQPIRALLDIADGFGALDRRYEPQVVGKVFDPDAKPPFGTKIVLAQDAVRLAELGFDAGKLGVVPVSERSEE